MIMPHAVLCSGCKTTAYRLVHLGIGCENFGDGGMASGNGPLRGTSQAEFCFLFATMIWPASSSQCYGQIHGKLCFPAMRDRIS